MKHGMQAELILNMGGCNVQAHLVNIEWSFRGVSD